MCPGALPGADVAETGVMVPKPDVWPSVPRGDMEGLEDFLERVGRGADIGPVAETASPIVFISSGWNRPRLEFLSLKAKVEHLGL